MLATMVPTAPAEGVRRLTISFNMHKLVLRCVCITLVLHGIGLAATKVLGARGRGPTEQQIGLYYFCSAFALIAYAVAVTLIVRVRSGSGAVSADTSSLQPSPADHSVRCNAFANGAFLAAACVGPPLFLFFLVSPKPAVTVALACLAAACVLGLCICCCWSCWAAAPSDQPQFLSSPAGPTSHVRIFPCRRLTCRRFARWRCIRLHAGAVLYVQRAEEHRCPAAI